MCKLKTTTNSWNICVCVFLTTNLGTEMIWNVQIKKHQQFFNHKKFLWNQGRPRHSHNLTNQPLPIKNHKHIIVTSFFFFLTFAIGSLEVTKCARVILAKLSHLLILQQNQLLLRNILDKPAVFTISFGSIVFVKLNQNNNKILKRQYCQEYTFSAGFSAFACFRMGMK